jgi:drug/metabolite transporter (DMT)-like permease
VNPVTLAYAAWIVVCLVWGTTYFAIRVALETTPPFLMAAFRWLAAGAILTAVLAARRERFPPVRDWPGLAILGFLLLGIGNGAVVWAEQFVPSGLAAVLVASMPFWLVGVERVLPHGEPVGRRRLAGLLVGFTGIVILVWPELALGRGRWFLAGVAATQLACLGWAIGSLYSRRRHVSENVLAAVALEMLFAGILLLAFGSALGEWRALAFTPRTFGAVVYLVVAGSIGGFTAYSYAIKHLPMATVSLYAYVNPLIAVLLGTLWLDEPFSARVGVAAAVVFAGMALVREDWLRA